MEQIKEFLLDMFGRARDWLGQSRNKALIAALAAAFFYTAGLLASL